MNISTAIKESFNIVWKNLILMQPPILFMLIMSLFLSGFNRVNANNTVSIIFILALIFLSIAFISGWLHMIKKTIAFEKDNTISNEDKAIQSFGLVKHFFPGVGEYFFPAVGIGFLLTIILFFSAFFAVKQGVASFGLPDMEIFKKSLELNTTTQIEAYFSTLPEEKIFSIFSWFFFLFTIEAGIQFILMWWAPALLYNTKNPLWALILNFKFLFKHFFSTLGILLFLIILNIVISLISSIFSQNAVLSLISFLLFFFYVTYYVVIIFLYYGQNGETTAKNYINNGDDCVGEKLASSEPSTED